ncbi:kelch-like protein 1 [Saccostrea cucullata]|uniref:kelch-like protein 1 n=1 Tax=Saccostrea cuccullata TaxID=36930 RepID=UPI002ED249A4
MLPITNKIAQVSKWIAENNCVKVDTEDWSGNYDYRNRSGNSTPPPAAPSRSGYISRSSDRGPPPAAPSRSGHSSRSSDCGPPPAAPSRSGNSSRSSDCGPPPAVPSKSGHSSRLSDCGPPPAAPSRSGYSPCSSDCGPPPAVPSRSGYSSRSSDCGPPPAPSRSGQSIYLRYSGPHPVPSGSGHRTSSSYSAPQSSCNTAAYPTDVPHHHFIQLGHYIMDKFQQQKLCDMAFKIGHKIIPVHKLVLGSQSPFFNNLFEEEVFLQEAVTPKIIRVSGVSEESLTMFLEFLYSGTINLKTTVLADLLKLARVFNLPKVKCLCLNHLKEARSEQLLEILPIMRAMEEVEYCDLIMRRIGKNFINVKELPSFFELDVDTLCLILSQDTLSTDSEFDIFCSAISWINHHNFEYRMQYLEKIMSHIRFPLMSRKELFCCFKLCPALKNVSKVVEMIAMANWIQTSYSLNEVDPLDNLVPRERNNLHSSQSVSSYMKTNCSTDVVNEPVKVEVSQMPPNLVQDFNSHARIQSASFTSTHSEDRGLYVTVEQHGTSKSKTFTRRKVKDIKKENNRRTGRKIPQDSPL